MSERKSAKPELDEATLIGMSDDEIRAATATFSYDVDLCRRRLRAGGPWNKVIQAHLFYDHVLMRLIEEYVTAPEHLKLDRAAFTLKLDLAAALGLITDWQKGFLRELNAMRNDLAHDLSMSVPIKFGRKLYGLLPPNVRAFADEARTMDKSTLLYGTLYIFAVGIEISRQRHAAERLQFKQARLKLN